MLSNSLRESPCLCWERAHLKGLVKGAGKGGILVLTERDFFSYKVFK